MQKLFVELNENEKELTNGGKFDIKADFGKVSPWEWGNQFGQDVLYPYVWKPIRNFFRK